MFVSGVDGVSERELMTLAGGADKVSEGARVSIGSSHSIFIVLIFFFRLSSFNFFLGRDRSKSAGSKEKGKNVCQEIKNNKKPFTEILTELKKYLHSRIAPFRPMFVLESMSPRWMSDVIKSGWS